MHKVAANYALPTVLNTLKPSSGGGLGKGLNSKVTGSTTSTTGTTSPASSVGDLGTTFLNLLSQELQNQDPTAPVDSTAMVGQMISLNQLDQLISINQTLTSTAGSTAGTTTGSVAPAGPVASGSALAPAIQNTSLNPAIAGAASNQLPFDPTTMMPLISGNSGTAAASINSLLNPTTLGLSGTNTTSGGK